MDVYIGACDSIEAIRGSKGPCSSTAVLQCIGHRNEIGHGPNVKGPAVEHCRKGPALPQALDMFLAYVGQAYEKAIQWKFVDAREVLQAWLSNQDLSLPLIVTAAGRTVTVGLLGRIA